MFTIKYLLNSTKKFQVDQQNRTSARYSNEWARNQALSKLVNRFIVSELVKFEETEFSERENGGLAIIYLSRINPNISDPVNRQGILVFDSVKVSFENKPGYIKINKVEKNNVKPSPIWIKPFSPSTKLQCGCDCPDFRHVFAWHLKDSLISSPEPYSRKTTTYPERNPKHIPGICKHQLAIIRALMKKKVLLLPESS